MINRNWLQVKRAIFKSAREVYVLADSSKFGVGYVSVICPANLLKDLGKKSGEIEVIRVNPSKNNSTESQNLPAIPQITPTINSNSIPSQSTAPEESLTPIFVASEQGLDASV